ncbi:hypothetical protein [Paenibacillus sp. HB172176]|uniref:hypothetical protein n=1 Tax=Paenibacillus sp. HB172176 TaxID=2493690 RepID=UPI001438C880|nr:hypothetical protein [Paenibacillus sp. HB172176]
MKAMKPENLIYTFVSYASHYDTPWGKGVALEGIDRTAALAHKYNIPVTWIVNKQSVPILEERINRWHEEFGDNIILQTPFFIEDCGMDKAKFKAALEDAWGVIQGAFPWAGTKVAARGKIYNEVIQVLEELDFKGMWGYCWEQVWWDGITHKGIPWGSWYVDPNRYKVPHPGKGKVVACEWTARDLNLTYHSGSPVIYSTDPNDVLRAGLCTGDNIDYWKNLFEDYLVNTALNDQVFFLQQQEAHEMEFTEQFAVFPASHVEGCEGMLDLFFQHITQYEITLTTLPHAMELYHAHNEETAPVYMLTKDTKIRPEINEYTMTMGGVGCGPWPNAFLYYDKECQMAFVEGENTPRTYRSYVGKGNMHDEFVEATPQVFVSKYEKTDEHIRVVYEISYWKRLPFGLAYWDALEGFEVAAFSGCREAKLIGEQLVFLRLELTGEPCRIELLLKRA